MNSKKTYKRKNVTNGQKREPRSLDEILGFTKRSTYETHDSQTYEKQIRSYNSADLCSHAIDVGIQPSTHRESLISKLVKEFKVANSSYGSVLESKAVKKNNTMTAEKRKKALDIMSKGR